MPNSTANEIPSRNAIVANVLIFDGIIEFVGLKKFIQKTASTFPPVKVW